MAQLREFLREVEQEEKEEAIQYYKDYLEEAGILEEMEVPETFGTPQRIAQTVKNGLSGKFEEESEFTEKGFQEFEEPKNLVDSFAGLIKSKNQTYQEKKRRYGQRGERGMGIAAILLIIAAGMIGGPVVLSVLAALASVIFCVVIVVGVGIFTSVAVGAALLFAGAALCGV